MNRSRDDFDDGESVTEPAGNTNFTLEDLKREEQEVRELEERKRTLEERVNGMERDLGGLMR